MVVAHLVGFIPCKKIYIVLERLVCTGFRHKSVVVSRGGEERSPHENPTNGQFDAFCVAAFRIDAPPHKTTTLYKINNHTLHLLRTILTSLVFVVRRTISFSFVFNFTAEFLS